MKCHISKKHTAIFTTLCNTEVNTEKSRIRMTKIEKKTIRPKDYQKKCFKTLFSFSFPLLCHRKRVFLHRV